MFDQMNPDSGHDTGLPVSAKLSEDLDRISYLLGRVSDLCNAGGVLVGHVLVDRMNEDDPLYKGLSGIIDGIEILTEEARTLANNHGC